MINSYEEYIKLINEGLITTHRISKYKNMLENMLNTNNIKYILDINDDTFELTLYNNEEIYYKGIISFINTMGYFPSSFVIKKDDYIKYFKYDYNILLNNIQLDNFKEIKIRFEAKFDKIITDIPDFIYHVYKYIYRDKILNIGLVPRSRMRKSYHPDRCYFTYTRKESIELINEFKLSDFINKEKEVDYSVMGISTKDMKDIRFYKDPNSIGFYTHDNIDPKYIIE